MLQNAQENDEVRFPHDTQPIKAPKYIHSLYQHNYYAITTTVKINNPLQPTLHQLCYVYC